MNKEREFWISNAQKGLCHLIPEFSYERSGVTVTEDSPRSTEAHPRVGSGIRITQFPSEIASGRDRATASILGLSEFPSGTSVERARRNRYPTGLRALNPQNSASASESMTHLGLRVRMILAGGPLIAIYGLFALGFLAAGVPLLVIVLVSLGFIGFQYLVGLHLALWSVGAQEVTEDRFTDLQAAAQRLAEEMGVEQPRLMVADMGVPNAFTVGRKGGAVIVVASELLYVLDDDEVDGVLAHELAHVRNRDVVVMVVGHSIAAGIGYVLEKAFEASPDHIPGTAVIAAIISGLAEKSLLVFVLAISRYREYVADDDAAEYIGGGPLASALETIHEVDQRSPAAVNQSVAALCIFGGERGFLGRVFASHPPVEKRIERLQAR